MKALFKKLISILCIIGSLYIITGCTESVFFPDDNINLSDNSLITRSSMETPYYFYDNEKQKVYLSLNTEYAFFSVQDSLQTIKQTAKSTENNFRTTNFRPDINTNLQYKGKVPTSRFYTELNLGKMQSDGEYITMLSDIKKLNNNVIIAPYFNDIYGNKIGLSNFFYVRLKSERDIELLERMAEETACIIVSQDEFMPLWYLLSVTETTELNALECSNLYYESGLFSFAEPDFMADNLFCTNDPLFSQQWHLPRIDIESAWNQSTGRNITVAVVDGGVELNHPDLAANMHPLSYDANTGTMPQQVRHMHGTAVAGIIGAIADNGIGVAGVAPDCRLMSISSAQPNGTLEKLHASRAVNWAWQNGAHVINCSWSQPTALTGDIITEAVYNAVSNGRGGLGCVVVGSSGNDGASSVSFPARLVYVIGVGAIDQNGRRASYSNYGGQTLSVVAPGEGIWTTDRQGAAGYVTGDYTDFRGTSAAAPIVSGIAALILSRYPDMPWQSVKNAIEQGTRSSGYPATYYLANGSYNPEVGYGPVDARLALSAAKTEMDLVNLSSTPAIDFRITNNTSYDVNSIWIVLTGKVGSTTTTLIQRDPGGVPARSILEGFPNHPGNRLTAAPGTAITNLNLQLYANTSGFDKVKVYVAIDTYAFNIWKEVNFNGGNTVNISPPNTTVPSASRRTLNIVIEP